MSIVSYLDLVLALPAALAIAAPSDASPAPAPTFEDRLSAMLRAANRAGPFEADGRGCIVDAVGHTLALTVPVLLEPDLRQALAEFFARSLNALPASPAQQRAAE